MWNESETRGVFSGRLNVILLFSGANNNCNFFDARSNGFISNQLESCFGFPLLVNEALQGKLFLIGGGCGDDRL